MHREPNNPYDKNAIQAMLHVPILFGLLGHRYVQIGYIKKGTARSLAKKMDAGEKFEAKVESFWSPFFSTYPRVTITISDEGF